MGREIVELFVAKLDAMMSKLLGEDRSEPLTLPLVEVVRATVLLLLLEAAASDDERPDARDMACPCPFRDDVVLLVAVLAEARDMVPTPDVARLADDCAGGRREANYS
jgi:hypothetical protein